MSLHASNPETEARLRRQRVNSSVASFVIGGLVVALLMILMALILLAPYLRESQTIVAYQGASTPDETINPQQRFTPHRSKPSAPSSAMARVIAANTTSPTAIPVPELNVDAVSETFGTGDDFGDGWGFGDGDGSGFGGGTTFFQQKVQAQRVAYVIDYSLSMKGQGRESLMRNELKKSVESLTLSMEYQLIFFAGPAWVAGDEVTMAKDKKSAVVKHKSDEFKWVSGGAAHDWEPKGAKRKPEWLRVESSTRQNSVNQIQGTDLVWGTHWQPAIEMALGMEPPPEVIFFMTDGVTGGDVMQLVRTIGAKAKAKNIVINTVAMMEPKAEEAMRDLAKRTGGQFTIVDKNGKVKLVPLK